MQKYLIFLAIMLLCFSCIFAQKHPITVEDLWNCQRLRDVQLSPNDTHVAYVVTSYTMENNSSNSDLWLVSLEDKKNIPLTNNAGHETTPRWSPDGKKLAFLANDQICIMDIETKKIECTTQLPVCPDEFIWTNDGAYFLFITQVYPGQTIEETIQTDEAKAKSKVKARVIDSLLYRHWNMWTDGKVNHLFAIPVSGGTYRDLTPGPNYAPPIALGGERDYCYCPKTKNVFYTTNTDSFLATSTNNDIYCVNIEGGQPKQITKGFGNDNSPVVSPDGKYLAYLSMARPRYEADELDLILLNLETNTTVNLTEEFDRDVGYPIFSNDYIYFTSANHGRLAIYRIKIAGGIVETVIPDHTNKSLNVTKDGETLVFLQESVSMPSEIFTAKKDGTEITQITFTNKNVLDNLIFQPVEDFWFESFDGWRVHGLLVKPPYFDPTKKYPVVFLIHGGPQGNWSDEFHYRWNLAMFTSPGYVVLAIDFRGSKGYGQKFCDAVSGDWGGGPYKDLMVGLDVALKQYPFMDEKRIGAAGASYGGFMVNWIAGHTDRFSCLISHAGVFDLYSKYGATEELWFPEWEFRGTPYQNPEQYEKFSPSRYATYFKTPTMVVHGELDFRVPITQGFQMFTALQRQGVPSKLVYFPDEGHFVAKAQNARLWWKEVYGWLARWLK